MSKTTKQPSNLSSSSSVYLNGMPKMQTVNNSNGQIYSNYTMSPWEQMAYEYSQKEFANNLPNVNVFSKETLKNLSDEIDAYKAQGIKQINDIYSPMLKNLQNDVASRFGNLDNSIFLDKLNNIEDKRADSVNALSQDISAKSQELTQNELMNRYNYLNFLNNYQNQFLQNATGMMNATQGGLNSNLAFMKNNSANNGNLQSQMSNAILGALLGGLPKLPL